MPKPDDDMALALAASNVALGDLAQAMQMLLTACRESKVKFGRGKLQQIVAALDTSAVVTVQNARILRARGGGNVDG